MPPAMLNAMVGVMAFIGVRLSDQLAARFEAVAVSRGGKSKVLRALMESAVQGSVALPDGEAEVPSGRSTKITLRLKDADLVPLDAACADTGLRRTEWLVALARRRLHGTPQFDRAAAEGLLEARRELRRLSVNLRELAEPGRAGEGASAEALEALRREVRAQLERVRAAIAGNLAYWDTA